MKITEVKLSDPMYTNVKQSTDATVVNPAIRASSLVQISTDEGITGFASIGEPQVGPEGVTLNKLLIEHMFKPLVVGEDPLDTERIWDKLYWGSVRWGRRGVVLSVIGGIDIASVGSEREDSQSTSPQTARCPQGHGSGVRE